MFDASADQELLAETSRKYLSTQCPLSKVRELARTKHGFEADYWKRGAELGWTSLVVPEEAGGGSVSGSGILDLVLVSYEFGRHAAPGPLAPTNVVAAAVGRWGSEEQVAGPLASILSGTSTASYAFANLSVDGRNHPDELSAVEDGDTIILSGIATPVEGGAQAAIFLVGARLGAGMSHCLVSANEPELTISPLSGLDLTRRFARLQFNDLRVPKSSLVGTEPMPVSASEWLNDLAVVVQLAEMVGAMQWAFDTTLDWVFNRYSFGRPLASYQEIKHRFADMKMWLEACYAISWEAARAVEVDAPNRAELVSAGKLYAGRYGPELVQDCVQLHGGIGVTFDHDLHIFLRRVATDASTLGSPSAHAARLARIIEAKGAQE